jgi:hypothetical protein
MVLSALKRHLLCSRQFGPIEEKKIEMANLSPKPSGMTSGPGKLPTMFLRQIALFRGQNEEVDFGQY